MTTAKTLWGPVPQLGCPEGDFFCIPSPNVFPFSLYLLPLVLLPCETTKDWALSSQWLPCRCWGLLLGPLMLSLLHSEQPSSKNDCTQGKCSTPRLSWWPSVECNSSLLMSFLYWGSRIQHLTSAESNTYKCEFKEVLLLQRSELN